MKPPLLRLLLILTVLVGLLLKPTPAAALNLGDSVTLNFKWKDENGQAYPMNGVQVTVRDLSTGATSDITGYFLNGTFSFNAPRNGYTYTVILRATFPGVNASGAVVAGGGTGSFTMKKPDGTVLTESAGANVVNYNSPKGGGATLLEGDIWPVFHGVAEMVRETRRRLTLDKDAFTVVFPHTGISSFDPSTKNVRINLLDRYDWDVVAHEFGHAIADQTNAVNSYAGGGHDGSNQYSYAPNTGTFGSKANSLNLAFNEGFGTWIGGSLLERSDFKGRFPRVGDGKYTDTEDSSQDVVFEDNTSQTYFGDDTENAIYQLLFDLEDSSNEANKRTSKISGLRDRTSLGLVGLWNLLKGSAVENISDFWKTACLPQKKTDAFLPGTGNAVTDPSSLGSALATAETFAEFGVAPLLFKPGRGTKLQLDSPPAGGTNAKFEWSQEATGAPSGTGPHPNLKLNKYQLVIYSGDLQYQVFEKSGLTGNAYTLTDADREAIKASLKALKDNGHPIASVKAAIIGTSDVTSPTTGPYLSNGVELLIQAYNRAVVAVVDSSGSNSSTDPSFQRVVASKQSLMNLVSEADAAADPTKVSDIAAAIDFDSSVTVLSNFADPDTVAGTLNSIDAFGGTSIDAGINQAIALLDAIPKDTSPTETIAGLFKDRGSILLFTDGQNNAGDAPVIAAIAAATSKGYRVHYGFLNPFFTPKPSTENWAPEPGATLQPIAASAPPMQAPGAPATIQEAVLQSGGIFGIISDASSQFAFVQQVFSRGLSNADETNAPGGKLVGQTQTTEQLDPNITESAFEFNGTKGENARVIVTSSDFNPTVTVYDRLGNIIGFQNDDDGNQRVEIPITLPYTGKYSVQVYSTDGTTGFFNIFVDVENARFTYTRVAVQSELYERLATAAAVRDPAFAGKYAGLITPDVGGKAGSISFNLTRTGIFTATALLNGVKFILRGEFDENGDFLGVMPNSKGDVTLDLKLASTSVGRKITGTISGDGFSSTLAVDQSAFDRRSNPSQAVGNYTFVIPSETDAAIPGDGFGTVKIGADGSVRLAGALGDSTPISVSAFLSQEGTFPISVLLYRSKTGSGSISGEITARSTDPGQLDGSLDWTKPRNDKDKLYPAGFSGTVPFIGSRYRKPDKGQRILALQEIVEGNLRMSFGEGGVLPTPGERFLFVDTRNRAKLTAPNPDEGLALSFSTANGLFRGKVPEYITGTAKKRAFRGAVLQSQNRGSGHFVGVAATGFAYLEPYDPNAIRVTNSQKVTAVKDQFFSLSITGVNGVVSAGANGLPNWLIYGSISKVVSGTPPQTGVFYFTVFVKDNTNRIASQTIELTVLPGQ